MLTIRPWRDIIIADQYILMKGSVQMNLKEAFRYQNFLDGLCDSATCFMLDEEHCQKTTKHHHMHDVNPDVEDKIEEVQRDDAPSIDLVIQFAKTLIYEKLKLTNAIEDAKRAIPFGIESAIASNKFRQRVHNSLRIMMECKPGIKKGTASAFKFNNEGNQTPYYYNVDIETEDTYDRENAKAFMRECIIEADKISNDIDSVMINTEVSYDAPWDVNDNFLEVIAQFGHTLDKLIA